MDVFVLPHFKVEYVPKGYSAQIQRSVLNQSWRVASQLPIEKQCRRILSRYRELLESLTTGWKPLSDERRQVSLKNCAPSHFVAVQSQRNYCMFRQICPWCHARWVRTIWDKFTSVMYSADESNANSPYSAVFVEADARQLSHGWEVENWLQSACKSFKIAAVAGAAGYVAWTQLVPGAELDKPIIARRNFLGIIRDPVPLDGVLVRPNKRQLASMFAATFPYPRELITGDPGLLGYLLNLQHGKRLCWQYGVLRGRNTQP